MWMGKLQVDRRLSRTAAFRQATQRTCFVDTEGDVLTLTFCYHTRGRKDSIPAFSAEIPPMLPSRLTEAIRARIL